MPAGVPPPSSGFFSRLRDGLRKTRDSLREKLEGLFGNAPVDESTLESIEEALLASDLGPATTMAILDSARSALRRQGVTTAEAMRAFLADRIAELLKVGGAPHHAPTMPPHITLFHDNREAGQTVSRCRRSGVAGGR